MNAAVDWAANLLLVVVLLLPVLFLLGVATCGAIALIGTWRDGR